MPAIKQLATNPGSSAQTGPEATMDDTAYIMDDTNLLMGGPVAEEPKPVVTTAIVKSVSSPMIAKPYVR